MVGNYPKTTEQQRLTVHNEFDIINLRQSVRQFSRTLGLDLPHQAKVTVAISTLAQAFLSKLGSVVFTLQVCSTPRPALEIICICQDAHHAHTTEQFERHFAVSDIHVLVDEFCVALHNDTATLTVREWL